MNNPIDISHLDKGAVLAALYNASRPLGMGFIQYDPKPMLAEQGREILKHTTRFDYLSGRVMKISLDSDMLDPRGYDHNNGQGAAARAIDALRIGGANAPSIEHAHKEGTRQSATEVRERLSVETTLETDGNVATMKLGLSDVAEPLGAKVNEAIQHANQ